MAVERAFEKYINFEQERQAFNKFQGVAEISVDFLDNQIITDVFTLRNYESETIVTVIRKDDLYGRNISIGTKRLYNLLEAMRAKYDAGWTKADFEQYGEYEFAEYLTMFR